MQLRMRKLFAIVKTERSLEFRIAVVGMTTYPVIVDTKDGLYGVGLLNTRVFP